ncbi:Quinate/shikimate dehydrogenase (quinone) [Raoultella ornithinolytica]|nr:Quinate/shikimate dehydrogenase (quinone) [Raoultella ornithinolytica]
MTRVEERPVAHAGAEGERLSTTQPFSTGMPQLGVEPLTEKSMWGVTPFDQLMCRIDFKESTYLGMYTPPSEKPYIEWPSLLGGMNWGGITIDERTGTLFVNDMRMPLRMSLVRQEDMAKYKVSTDEVRALWAPSVRRSPGHMAACGSIFCNPRWGFRVIRRRSAR